MAVKRWCWSDPWENGTNQTFNIFSDGVEDLFWCCIWSFLGFHRRSDHVFMTMLSEWSAPAGIGPDPGQFKFEVKPKFRLLFKQAEVTTLWCFRLHAKFIESQHWLIDSAFGIACTAWLCKSWSWPWDRLDQGYWMGGCDISLDKTHTSTKGGIVIKQVFQ